MTSASASLFPSSFAAQEPRCSRVLQRNVAVAKDKVRSPESAVPRTARTVAVSANRPRRSRHALVQILAAAQDAEPEDALAARVHFLANGVLGMYPVEAELTKSQALGGGISQLVLPRGAWNVLASIRIRS